MLLLPHILCSHSITPFLLPHVAPHNNGSSITFDISLYASPHSLKCTLKKKKKQQSHMNYLSALKACTFEQRFILLIKCRSLTSSVEKVAAVRALLCLLVSFPSRRRLGWFGTRSVHSPCHRLISAHQQSHLRFWTTERTPLLLFFIYKDLFNPETTSLLTWPLIPVYPTCGGWWNNSNLRPVWKESR